MKNPIRILFFSCCLICLQMLSIQYLNAQGISVYPSRLFFHAAPGNSEIQTIHVTNEGKSDLLLEVYLKDWIRDSLGEKVYSPPSTSPKSNASWIRYTPNQLSIPAGTTRELSVRLTAPEQGAPFTNAMLFMSQINKQDTVFKQDSRGRNIGFVFRVEIGVHIYNSTAAANSVKKLRFIKLEELPKPDSLRRFEVEIKNEGEEATDATLRFQLTETTSGQAHPLPDKLISMLPGASQIIRFDLPDKLPKGNYQLMVLADGGDNSTLQIAKKQIVYE